MIKNIRKRFITACMSAVGVLIIVLLGIINIANTVYTGHQTDTKIELLLSEMETRGSNPFDFSFFSEKRFLEPELNENYGIGSVYFTAVFSPFGAIIQKNTDNIRSLTDDEISAIACGVYQQGLTEGKTGSFKFAGHTDSFGVTRYVFMDVSDHTYAVFRVAVLSAFAGLVMWGLMFFAVIAISNRAIKPIKENYERQQQFFTDAGHELKTPLAVILSNTEAMEMINGENKWTRNIRSQIQRLSGLTQDMLTIAKSGEGAKIEKTEFSLSELTAAECHTFEPGAENRGTVITPAIEDGIVYNGDREQIRRLISILLDNAVKYCSENSEIKISLSRSVKGAVLKVTNTCDALPPCPPAKLFDRFYRPDFSRSRQSGGNGIGLSAARAVAQAHGGNITAAYTDINTIEFTVTL